MSYSLGIRFDPEGMCVGLLVGPAPKAQAQSAASLCSSWQVTVPQEPLPCPENEDSMRKCTSVDHI